MHYFDLLSIIYFDLMAIPHLFHSSMGLLKRDMCSGIPWKLYIVEKVKTIEQNVASFNLQNIWGIQIQISHSLDRQNKQT